MALRDITKLMNSYRECCRNLWNVYFSGREDIGGSLDAFGQIREILFDVIVTSDLFYSRDVHGDDVTPAVLRIVPKPRCLILIQRLTETGQAGYWDQEKDMVVGPTDITLAFLDFFDFSDVTVMEFDHYRCKILSFPSHAAYEGREALLKVSDAKVFHDEPAANGGTAE